nr:ribonuclease H-like domain-containing protein [Tanacetum cinerariifolium]
MRPFGCPVTILNTIDYLGKFDGKYDEVFFVGYSLNSKAFKVFNSRIRIVAKNLHIRFSVSIPNVIGSIPDWLFDIDALTRTMNYEPIVTDPKSSHYNGSKPSSDDGKKVDEDPIKESECNDHEMEHNVNSTNNVNIIGNVNNVSSTVNAIGTNEVNVFWSTAMAKTINGEVQLHARVDGKEIIITESSIRRDLQLAYEEGVDCLPTSTIFKQLTLIGIQPSTQPQKKQQPTKPKRKDTQVTQPSDPIENFVDEAVHEELGDSLVRAATTASSLEVVQDSDEEITLVNVQDDADKEMFNVNVLDDDEVFVAEQKVIEDVNDGVNVVEEVVKVFNTAKLIIDDAQVSTVGDIVSTASIPVSAASAAMTVSAAIITISTITIFGDITLAQALEELKSTKPKEKGIDIQELGKSTPTKSFTTITGQRLDKEAALKLQAAFNEEERLAREKAKKLVEGKEKRAGIELIQEITNKQKVEADKEITELKQFMELIPDEKEVAINDIPLFVKSPKIVDWKIYKEGRKSYYQIMRADEKSQMYMVFSQMLKSFNMEDLEDLYKLVKAKYESTRPVEDLDLLLWVI